MKTDVDRYNFPEDYIATNPPNILIILKLHRATTKSDPVTPHELLVSTFGCLLVADEFLESVENIVTSQRPSWRADAESGKSISYIHLLTRLFFYNYMLYLTASKSLVLKCLKKGVLYL
ncbi:unnamed protein product [Microthlaspi erraticum]|uniref:Uncharacterized protein n=1 Tax=Microthlaspi erraticum TaxID=1685480 RepID=A0A6D2HLG8_9BRAS|nr:unnamed protein product [Microthlaspi erraticum]